LYLRLDLRVGGSVLLFLPGAILPSAWGSVAYSTAPDLIDMRRNTFLLVLGLA
jgi:hypothetical protein